MIRQRFVVRDVPLLGVVAVVFDSLAERVTDIVMLGCLVQLIADVSATAIRVGGLAFGVVVGQPEPPTQMIYEVLPFNNILATAFDVSPGQRHNPPGGVHLYHRAVVPDKRLIIDEPEELTEPARDFTKDELVDALSGLADFGEPVELLKRLGTDRVNLPGLGVSDIVPVEQCDRLPVTAPDRDDDTDAKLVGENALVALDVPLRTDALPGLNLLELGGRVVLVTEARVPPDRAGVAGIVGGDRLFRRFGVPIDTATIKRQREHPVHPPLSVFECRRVNCLSAGDRLGSSHAFSLLSKTVNHSLHRRQVYLYTPLRRGRC